MVAVTTTMGGFGDLPYLVPHTRPRLRSRRPARRLRALLLLSLLVLAVRTVPTGLADSSVPGGQGSAPLGAPEPVRASAVSPEPVVHIVQPGETLWAIARKLQPDGDVRPLIARLSAARHGAPLRVGERLELTPQP